MKTHFKKLRNPNYVGSWDLADNDGNYVDKIVTIAETKKEMVHDGKGGQEECTVVKLKETKPMVANATNLRMISKITGSPYIEDWIGEQIMLTVQKVKAFGEYHDAIRVKKPVVSAKPTLQNDAIPKVIDSIKAGSYTIEKLKQNYTVTNEQLQIINKGK